MDIPDPRRAEALTGAASRAHVLCRERGRLILRDAATAAVIGSRALPEPPPTALVVSHDGRFLVAALEQSFELWDLLELPRSLGPRQPLSLTAASGAAESGITLAAFAPASRWLALAQDDVLHLWDVEAERWLWFQDAGARLRALTFSPDGFVLAVATEHSVTLWEADSRQRLLELDAPNIKALCFDAQSSRLVIAQPRALRIWDIEGRYLMRWLTLDAIAPCAAHVSPDGKQVAVGSELGVEVYNLAQGERIAAWPDTSPSSLAWSADGSTIGWTAAGHFCLASLEGAVTRKDGKGIIEIVFLREDWVDSLPGRSVKRVRRALKCSDPLGLATWFDLFDRSLRKRRFSVCAALLDEIEAGGYPLRDTEQVFVESRQAALRFAEGAAHQLAGDYEAAAVAYEESRHLHEPGAAAAKEQVRLALELLEEEQQTGRRSAGLAALGEPLVVGGSEQLLMQRCEGAGQAARGEILSAALHRRLLLVLEAATVAEDVLTRALAFSALGQLTPLPRALLGGISDPHWFVRWRAARQWSGRIKSDAEAVAVLETQLAVETDCEARRTLCQGLGQLSALSSVPALLSAAADPDPDVAWAAIHALGRSADRRALPVLARLPDRQDSRDRWLREEAGSAAQEIEDRYPAPRVLSLGLWRIDLAQRLEEPASHFRSDERPTLSAQLSHIASDAQLCIRVESQAGELLAERLCTFGELVRETPAWLFDRHRPELRPLVELITPAIEVGMRVRCKVDGAGRCSELRSGDTGQIRCIPAGDPATSSPRDPGWLGVEWDRHVNGHNGRSWRAFGSDAAVRCPLGYGWTVDRKDVDLVQGREPPSLAVLLDWPEDADVTGDFLATLTLLDHGGEAEMELGAASFVVLPATLELQSVRFGLPHPAIPGEVLQTEIILGATPEVLCVASSEDLLDEGFADAPIAARLVSISSARTPSGSEALATRYPGLPEMLFWRWPTRALSAGDYEVKLRLLGQEQSVFRFRVIDHVHLDIATSCLQIDALNQPLLPTSHFPLDVQTIFCCVLVHDGPPLTELCAVWEYLSGDTEPFVIHEFTANLEIAGTQYVAFSMTRPDGGWPPGGYRFRVAWVPPTASPAAAASASSQSHWLHNHFTIG